MTWIDEETMVLARSLREPTESMREYARRLRRIDPKCGVCAHAEDRVLFPGCARPIRDLRGHRFGMLTVLDYGGRRGRNITWVCRCDCGRVGTRFGRNLLSGNTRSCGCQRGRGKGGTHAN